MEPQGSLPSISSSSLSSPSAINSDGSLSSSSFALLPAVPLSPTSPQLPRHPLLANMLATLENDLLERIALAQAGIQWVGRLRKRRDIAWTKLRKMEIVWTKEEEQAQQKAAISDNAKRSDTEDAELNNEDVTCDQLCSRLGSLLLYAPPPFQSRTNINPHSQYPEITNPSSEKDNEKRSADSIIIRDDNSSKNESFNEVDKIKEEINKIIVDIDTKIVKTGDQQTES